MDREERASTPEQITYTDDGGDDPFDEEEEEVPLEVGRKGKKRKAARKSKAGSDEEDVARISEKLHDLEEEHVVIKAARKEAARGNKSKGKAKQLVDLDEDRRIELERFGKTPYERFIYEKEAAAAHARAQEDSDLLFAWDNTGIRDRHAKAEDVTRRRKIAIQEKMLELGWAPEDLYNLRSSSFSAPKELTDRIWNNIKPEMVRLATRNKALRLKSEARDRQLERMVPVHCRYATLVAHIQPIPNRRFRFPERKQFVHLEAVKPFWEPEGATVDDESWTAALPSILTEVSAFEEQTKRAYFTQLALNLHTVGAPLDPSLVTITEHDSRDVTYTYLDESESDEDVVLGSENEDTAKVSDSITDEAMDGVFARFSSVFVCRSCESAQSYEEMIRHQKMVHATTRPNPCNFDAERKLIKFRLARLIKEGLEESTKDGDLDAAGPIFECHNCTAVKAGSPLPWLHQLGHGHQAILALKTRDLTWSEAQEHFLVVHLCNDSYDEYVVSRHGEITIKRTTEDTEVESAEQ
ncbi:hypothetical protein P7C70_g6241, partial [Phenoliferia sp. Uapishka_3]